MKKACSGNMVGPEPPLTDCLRIPEKFSGQTPGAFSGFKIKPFEFLEAHPSKNADPETTNLGQNSAYAHQSAEIEFAAICRRLEEKIRQRTAEMEDAKRKLRETYEQLVRSEKLAALGELVAEVGHEFNNKLMPVIAYTQLLKEQKFPQEVLHYLDIIEQSASAATAVANSLLNFARPSNSGRDPVDLNGTMRETLELLGYRLKKARVHLQVELAKDIPFTMADEKQIAQVFVNIINNAVQAMEGGGGQLLIRSLRQDDSIVFMFTDSGCGICRENLPLIFEPFFSTKKEHGTGLGLSVSRRLIDAHNGQIMVESEIGKGTTFIVRLPIRKLTDQFYSEEEFLFSHGWV